MSDADTGAIMGYSVKAKKKVEIVDPVIHQTKKGGFMAKGKCPETDITVCAMMSKENAEKALENGAGRDESLTKI